MRLILLPPFANFTIKTLSHPSTSAELDLRATLTLNALVNILSSCKYSSYKYFFDFCFVILLDVDKGTTPKLTRCQGILKLNASGNCEINKIYIIIIGVARRKTPRAASASWRWRFFFSVIGIDFVGSRHLVFN